MIDAFSHAIRKEFLRIYLWKEKIPWHIRIVLEKILKEQEMETSEIIKEINIKTLKQLSEFNGTITESNLEIDDVGQE